MYDHCDLNTNLKHSQQAPRTPIPLDVSKCFMDAWEPDLGHDVAGIAEKVEGRLLYVDSPAFCG